MNSETNLRALSSATVFPELNFSPAHMISRESFPPQGTSALWLIPCAMLAVAALALAADANAQQPDSGAPYDNSGGQYAPQYAEPAPQNGYAPPQFRRRSISRLLRHSRIPISSRSTRRNPMQIRIRRRLTISKTRARLPRRPRRSAPRILSSYWRRSRFIRTRCSRRFLPPQPIQRK